MISAKVMLVILVALAIIPFILALMVSGRICEMTHEFFDYLCESPAYIFLLVYIILAVGFFLGA